MSNLRTENAAEHTSTARKSQEGGPIAESPEAVNAESSSLDSEVGPRLLFEHALQAAFRMQPNSL
ncbi:MAG: hypothetical protein ACJAVC_001375 [Brevundimonas sp.]|jgi:hypothetical protein